MWHADGYDKLSPFGLTVHGCADGYIYVKIVKARFRVLYAIYSTRGVVESQIEHEAKPSVLSDSRPHTECYKSRRAR